MMKRFNTTGPCFPDEHYMMPALDRLPGVRQLVSGGDYFIVHAPRQTGKTTALQALVSEINAKGDMFAFYCTLESLQNAADVQLANKVIRELIVGNAKRIPCFPRDCQLPPAPVDIGQVMLSVRTVLTDICDIVGKPVVVFFDEADCLVGDVLMAFLQRVTNGISPERSEHCEAMSLEGWGHINREMALGTGRLDLCVEFRGARYAIEVKTSANFQGEKSYAQCAKYLDSLGLAEGWMPIFEKSKEKSWEEKIYSRDEIVDGRTIHVIGL